MDLDAGALVLGRLAGADGCANLALGPFFAGLARFVLGDQHEVHLPHCGFVLDLLIAASGNAHETSADLAQRWVL